MCITVSQQSFPKEPSSFEVAPAARTPDPGVGSSPCRMRFTADELRYLDVLLAALTPREREVTVAVCEGGDHEEVAARLCIAVPTLRTHLMRIHQKLGAENKADVVRFVSARLVEAYRTSDASLNKGPIHCSDKALNPKVPA